MNIAICDDQKECNAKLSRLLKNFFRRREINFTITEFICGAELVKNFSPGMFDFIFLDVQMPSFGGDETAKQIRAKDLSVDIIFVTNMKDQPLMGYNYNAKGFLFKEVSQEQIDELMSRLVGEMSRREDIGVYPVKLKFDNGTALLQLSRVKYFESRDKDICATTETETFEFREKLSNLEKNLCEKGFIRINRSFLLNISYVFKDFGDYLVLKTGENFSISRSCKDSVRRALRGKW
jgi:DNA-binding LytR/AlgR family response regulator